MKPEEQSDFNTRGLKQLEVVAIGDKVVAIGNKVVAEAIRSSGAATTAKQLAT